MRICLPGSANRFERAERERTLFSQRQAYTWVHPPGQPPHCKDVPPGEAFTQEKSLWMAFDVVESMADVAMGAMTRLFKACDTVASFKLYYPIRPVPDVAARWIQDEEFGRQRVDGINPVLLKLATVIPDNFPVTQETVKGVIPPDTNLARLLAERRLFLLDYEILHGLEPEFGRFCVAPMCLFWLDDQDRLMPLAIQLGQSAAEAEIIFTPKDDHWTWLMARAFVQSADGTYHEIVAHLARTHLVMEPFWVAACRTLPAQHPLYAILQPHFTGTLEINHAARTKLLASGGPIDESIAIGARGSMTLLGIAYERWTFTGANPVADLQARGLIDKEVLPNYHYRDDALVLYEAIGAFVQELLRVYYPDDESVARDSELQAWARELTIPDGARVKGLPFDDERIATFDQLSGLVAQVIFNCSVEHAAVNNGQYAQFGWIPNTPGALYLAPPKDRGPRNEANFVYALPDAYAVGQQLALVHLLSKRTQRPLGVYPDAFFNGVMPVRDAIDRFRGRLDDIGRAIQERNKQLPVPYVFLQPWIVSRSIAI